MRCSARFRLPFANHLSCSEGFLRRRLSQAGLFKRCVLAGFIPAALSSSQRCHPCSPVIPAAVFAVSMPSCACNCAPRAQSGRPGAVARAPSQIRSSPVIRSRHDADLPPKRWRMALGSVCRARARRPSQREARVSKPERFRAAVVALDVSGRREVVPRSPPRRCVLARTATLAAIVNATSSILCRALRAGSHSRQRRAGQTPHVRARRRRSSCHLRSSKSDPLRRHAGARVIS